MRNKLFVRRSRLLLLVALFALLCSLFTSCRQEDDRVETVPARHWVTKSVAVVAPLGDAATKARLERTADWFLENFREAQLQDSLAVSMKIEWYDETSADITALSETLAGREDLLAVIGPFSNEHVALFAPACMKKQKPLIVPTATSEDVIRRYAVTTSGLSTNTTPFLWSLTETDVEFTNLLMSAFATRSKYYEEYFKGGDNKFAPARAAIFSPNDAYGMTFNYWAPFYAQQDGIELQCNQQYDSTADLLSKLSDYRSVMSKNLLLRSSIFCAVETVQQLYDVVRANRQAFFDDPNLSILLPSKDIDDPDNDSFWQLFKLTFQTYFAFSDLSEEGLTALGPRGTKILQGTEGFSPYADPSTGFEMSYKSRYGVLPTFSECKFYDALMLAGFAACYQEHQGSIDLNQAIIAITTNSTPTTLGGPAWSATTMGAYLSAMERGQRLNFIGASGEISFDRDTYTAATTTTYVHWQIFDDQIMHRQYFGSTGGRTSDATAAWLYLYNEQQASNDFQKQADGGVDRSFDYPALADQYAVLVQGSEGYSNYRHQADVLSVYQTLRRGGFTDDHIILILDKKMSSHTKNPEPGIVRNAVDGRDLLGGTDGLPAAVIDYDSSDLTPHDVADILAGRSSSRLPVVLPQQEGHNVLFYWSGHGHNARQSDSDEFAWRDAYAGEGFTADLLRQTVQQMKYRKLLIVAEPCYGECVVQSVKGLSGVLAISGAGATEQSWADHWSDKGRVWMCDRFSLNLVQCITDNPDTRFRDLFLYCAQHTLGSHARIVNADYFGNLYITGPAEFFRYGR